MKIRADVADMIRDGATTTAIMTALHVGHPTVIRARDVLGIPAPTGNGRPVLPIADMFRTRAEPVDGGHLRWTGHISRGLPILCRSSGNVSAYRVAFTLKHDREPTGLVRSACGYPRCVAPDHVQDQPMRRQLDAQYAAIFGDTG